MKAEYLLKKQLFRFGVGAIEDVLSTGRFTPLRNTEQDHFIATDLEDLDLDPTGARLSAMGAADEINDRLRFLSEDPRFEP